MRRHCARADGGLEDNGDGSIARCRHSFISRGVRDRFPYECLTFTLTKSAGKVLRRTSGAQTLVMKACGTTKKAAGSAASSNHPSNRYGFFVVVVFFLP